LSDLFHQFIELLAGDLQTRRQRLEQNLSKGLDTREYLLTCGRVQEHDELMEIIRTTLKRFQEGDDDETEHRPDSATGDGRERPARRRKST
jgi:hypothetical protein